MPSGDLYFRAQCAVEYICAEERDCFERILKSKRDGPD